MSPSPTPAAVKMEALHLSIGYGRAAAAVKSNALVRTNRGYVVLKAGP